MKRHGTYNAEGAEQTRLEITFGCPAFLCLMGCVWTWRGMLLFLCALLLHEAGHAIVLRLVHVRVKAVRLGFGDVEMETAPLGYWEELLSAWAGPCVNFLLYLALWRIAPAFAAVNLLLGAYNLLPVLPLDGGRMLLAALYLRLPEQTAWLIGRIWSLLVITCLLVLALWAAGAGRAGLLPLVMVLGSYARLALREKSVAFCGGNRYNK